MRRRSKGIGFDKREFSIYNCSGIPACPAATPRRVLVESGNVLPSSSFKEESKVGFLGVFASSSLENSYREKHLRDDLWWSQFLIAAGMIRVALMLLADYQNFGLSATFELLAIGRFVFLLISSGVLVALRRVASPTKAGRLLFGWCLLSIGMAFFALSSRDPNHNGLLMASFSPVLVAYILLPLPLALQTTLAVTQSAAILSLARKADGLIFAQVGATHAMAHLFGIVVSRRSLHRRRMAFLGVVRESALRAELQKAIAEIRSLEGLVHMCAWCKRLRDGAETWETIEEYVHKRTHASFSHGICPECLKAELTEKNHRSHEPSRSTHLPSLQESNRKVADPELA